MILIVSAALHRLILPPHRPAFPTRACIKGGHYSLEGTLFTSEKCPGEQYSPVNNVQGDIIHSDTVLVVSFPDGTAWVL